MIKLAAGLVLGALLLAMLSCSKLQDDIPPAGGELSLHGPGWTNPAANTFHGKSLPVPSQKLQQCLTCHGADFQGGTSKVSCIECHQSRQATLHGRGWTDTASANFHGNAIRTANWDMSVCKTCHGSRYEGGLTGVSCLTCHTNPTGPEYCTTCHGSSDNLAPPRDLNGNTDRTAPGVGAHQQHYVGSTRISSLQMPCSGCHIVPPTLYSPGHVDTPEPAEVTMTSGLSVTPSEGLIPSPTYNTVTMRCDNSFCHGNWQLKKSSSPNGFIYTDSVIVGANYSPLWTGTSAEAACGTCHTNPPAGHYPYELRECYNCHTGIMNAAGQIVDKSKHINGKVNVFGQERSF